MAEQLTLGIRLTADGRGLVGEVRLSREELEKLRQSTQEAGDASERAADQGRRYNQSLNGIGTAARATGLAVAALAAAVIYKTRQWVDNAASLARWKLRGRGEPGPAAPGRHVPGGLD